MNPEMTNRTQQRVTATPVMPDTRRSPFLPPQRRLKNNATTQKHK